MTPEDQILMNKAMHSATRKAYQDNKKLIQRTKSLFESSIRQIKISIKNNAEVVNCIEGSLLKHEKFLKELKKSNENVDETVCNILLAIRQNEYLQAWYPEQAMKRPS
jgi:hypothetical protein